MGQIIFIIGIVMALISAAKLPLPGTNWSNILPWYGVAVVLTIVGLWFWHRLQRAQSPHLSSSFSAATAKADLIELLTRLQTEIQTLAKDIKTLDNSGIITRIETILQLYLWPVVTQQDQLSHWLNRQQTVTVILAVAETERLLNRIWSATMDGYLEEAYLQCPKIMTIWKECSLLNDHR